jgi:hypothetical protein
VDEVVCVRDKLFAIEDKEGITEAHQFFVDRLIERGAKKLNPFAHQSQSVAWGRRPNGRYLAVGSWVGDDYDRGETLIVWDIPAARVVQIVDPVSGGVRWPDYPKQLQCSADSERLGVGINTNDVAMYDLFREKSAILDEAYVTDRWSRPPAWSLAPDGARVHLLLARSRRARRDRLVRRRSSASTNDVRPSTARRDVDVQDPRRGDQEEARRARVTALPFALARPFALQTHLP